METLAIIGLVGNIVQFVDFSGKLVSKSAELYRSSEGSLAENSDIETAINHLVLLNNKLNDAATTTGDSALQNLCKSCGTTADQLLAVLDKVKVKGKQDKWKSIRKALRSVWSKEEIEELGRRLERFRGELNLHVTVDLREQVRQFTREGSNRLEDLDITTKRIVDAIIKQEDVFRTAHNTQITLMGAIHEETVSKIQDEHAITRREIIQEIRDMGAANQEPRPATSCKTCWYVPLARNQKFVGRSAQLNELETNLFTEGHCPKFAIIGLGGVGKTQIALELAYRIREKHPDYSVFWVPATSTESLQQAYVEVGQQLRIIGLEEKKEDIKKLVQDYLSQESAGQWLLILDNADDMDMWFKKSDINTNTTRLIDYLPRSSKGSIVFTTRSRKAAVKFADRNVIQVTEMDKDAATQVLRNSLINKEILNDHAVVQLLRQLTFLPLAIVQAAAYINENDISLAEYLSLLDDREENIVEVLSEDFEDEGRYHDIKNPIATTWLISFEQIRIRDSLAADYLSFMSCIDPKAIPLSLLPPAQSKKKIVDAIGTLSAYSFIVKRPDDQSLDIHRLVHLATRNWLRAQDSLSEWIAKAIAQLADVFPNDNHENRILWRTYLPHAQYVYASDLFQENFKGSLLLLQKFGLCLLSDGRWDEAEKPFMRVMEASARVLGQEHPDTLTSMADLASTFRNQGRWKEAEELNVQVMEMRKRVLGQEHPDTLTSMANLASTYQNQGRWKEAEELNVQVMETRKRVLGQEHPDTLTSMADLVSTFWNQGRWKEAEELDVQVIKTRKRVLGQEHPDTLTSMADLVSTFWNQGRWKEAEELNVQVIKTRKRVLGQEHPDTLTSMADLASTFWNQGRWKEAEELNVQVMETRKRVLGQEHPDTLTSMANLASTYQNQGRWKDAEELNVQVMETSVRVLGQEHPKTLASIANLASGFWNQGRWKEAEELNVQVMETTKRVLGQEHPDTLTIIANLASTYQNQGRWKEAEELDVQVMETRKRVLGQEHPDTLTSIANLASTYQNQGRWKDAEELNVQVMETRKRVLGQEHPDMLISMANLAFTWKLQCRDNEALALMEECFKLRKKKLGPDHPNTMSSLRVLNKWQMEKLALNSVIRIQETESNRS